MQPMEQIVPIQDNDPSIIFLLLFISGLQEAGVLPQLSSARVRIDPGQAAYSDSNFTNCVILEASQKQLSTLQHWTELTRKAEKSNFACEKFPM